MRSFFTRILRLMLLILLPGILSAQAQPDYNIRLNSGKFIPPENKTSISRSADVFTQSLYGGKYYILIQFLALPGEKEKERLKSAGITLIDYIPNLAYTARVNGGFDLEYLRSFQVRSIFRFTTVHKTVPEIISGNVPAHAIKLPGFADLSVISYELMNPAQIKSSLDAIGGVILEDMPMFRSFTIRVPQASLKRLVDLPWVQWVEYVEPPVHLENTLGRTLHRVSVLNDGARNLKGDGVNIGIWDEGEISPHLDFSPAGRVTQVEFNSPSQHSTHCAGTILGRGIINQTARGMAPNASLFSYNFSGNIQTEMANAIPANNLIVSSHSYGGSVSTCSINGSQIAYSSTSRATDLNLNAFPTHLHVHSSGNSQGSCPSTSGYYTITGSGKTAKNNILCANITTSEALSGSSSCGPTQDGRVKPDISAFGTSVFSTSTPLNSYATLSGTSMATPGVSGSVALLVQRYKQLNGNTVPPSALIKNCVLNTAHDLGNPGPDYRFGYGRINALEAVKVLEQNRYIVNSIATGSTIDHPISVPAGAARLRVMIVWNDPAGAANSNPSLVNNLDLSVINGGNTTLPWILDPNTPAANATRGVDVVSNVEQVTIDNPASGTYTLRVNGLSVPTGPTQEYTLTWSVEMPFIEVTYPVGGESFNPGSNETITWNNAGVTTNQTVEYSLDGGSTWNVISSTVASGTTRLVWNVASGNTSNARIRVSAGALSHTSNNFKILGSVTGFTGNGTSCAAGEVNFSWNPVTNATHYDIYNLNTATGQFSLLVANLTGTSYTATGLTPNASMWFTIRSRNNSTNAESERANAINVTVSNGGGGIGVVGPITGPASICGNPNNVAYSIAPVQGATSYIWTAPPGASIASGQGNTSVMVNFPPGSTNGNLSVAASNGSCQTTPSDLAITINTTPAAPTGGGNQSQTVCLPNTIPTLTATASVPAGHTVVWYNAATGGTVVPSPTLNTAGSVTYYAASVNSTTNCESNTRTAVTLTITTVAQASVTASGATTFCQGGSVTLTANSGTSYSWSNGATTQSINVNTSGAYTVTVTTSGCTSTSPATNVTVNPLPTATISAGGPLAFCQGGSVTLTASAGSSWSWSNGATTQSINVSNPGNYTVTVTSAAGCSASSSATSVSVSPNPAVTITAAPYSSLFPGLVTNLTANVTPAGTYNYTWYKDNTAIPGAVSQTLSGIDAYKLGSYKVTVMNTTGLPCTNTSNNLVISDSTTTRLFILPNPNRGRFEVVYHSNGSNAYTLRIYDSKGGHVYQKSYNISSPYQRMDVDMRHMGRGLYHVVLTNAAGKRLATGKVVIQ
ncbi:MAG: S8 family serine peptidase [Chitinophagaceae bacterium]